MLGTSKKQGHTGANGKLAAHGRRRSQHTNDVNKSVIVLANITNIHSHRFIRHFKAHGWKVRIISVQPPNEENRQEFGDAIVNVPTYRIYDVVNKASWKKNIAAIESLLLAES